MRYCLLTMLLLSVTTLAPQSSGADPLKVPGKPLLAVEHVGHLGQVVDFDFTPDGKKLFTLGVDNTIQIWDATTHEHLKTLRLPWKPGPQGTLVGFERHPSIVVAPDGKALTVAVDNQAPFPQQELLLVHTETGRMIHLPGVGKGDHLNHLTFSRDGEMLAALIRPYESADKNTKTRVCLWRGLQKSGQADSPTLTLEKEWKFNTIVRDIDFAPDGSRLAISFFAPAQPIRLLNLKELAARPREIAVDGKDSKRNYSVTHLAWSPEGSRLAAEVTFTGGETSVILWTLEGLELRRVPTGVSCRPVFRSENELLLLSISHVDKENTKWRNVTVSRFDLQKNRRDEVVRCTLPEGGAEVSRFKITSDYQRAAIGNKAQKIAVLDLEPNAKVQPLFAQPTKPQFALSKKGHKIAWTGNDKSKFIAGIDLQTAEPLPPAALKAEDFGPPGTPGYNNRGLVELKYGGIHFTVYAAGQDWIVMTPEGYYAASPGGEKLVGWHVNNGSDKLASFYPFERFRKKLHRPDVIALVLEKGSVSTALKVANALLPKGAVPVNEEVADLAKLLPPVVELRVVDKSKLPVVQFKVSARAGTKEQPIRSMRLFVDGRPFTDPKAAVSFTDGVPKAEREWTVELPPGKHQVAVFARSADASGVSNEVAVDCRPSSEKPVLHLLAIGINEYEVKALNLACPANDAQLLAKTFQSQCVGELFGEVRTTVLLNKDATSVAIRAAIEKLRTDPQTKAKANDLVVVFFAGHGVKEKDQFYLLTHEAKVDELATTTLSGKQLRDALAGFPCQVLLMLDACQSAGFGAKGKLAQMNLKPATDEATRTLTDDEVGVAVMCAAMGNEKAVERGTNGLFTKAVVEALLATKDVPYNHVNQRQYIHHLQAYVFDKVSEESQEKQHPFLHLPWVVESFALRTMASK